MKARFDHEKLDVYQEAIRLKMWCAVWRAQYGGTSRTAPYLMRRCWLTERATAAEHGLGTGAAVSYLVDPNNPRRVVEHAARRYARHDIMQGTDIS